MEFVEILKNLFENNFSGINQLEFVPLKTENFGSTKYSLKYNENFNIELDARKVTIGGLDEEMELLSSLVIRRTPDSAEVNLSISNREALWEEERHEIKRYIANNPNIFEDAFNGPICKVTYDERLYVLLLKNVFTIRENKEIILVTDFISDALMALQSDKC